MLANFVKFLDTVPEGARISCLWQLLDMNAADRFLPSLETINTMGSAPLVAHFLHNASLEHRVSVAFLAHATKTCP